MSYAVQQSFWHYWQPGAGINPDIEAGAKYLRWLSKNRELVKLTIQALAFDANVYSETWQGEDYQARGVAETWVSVPNIAERIERSVRQTQRILHKLDDAHEIQILACDGRWCYPNHKHYKTNHYRLFQPDTDPAKWEQPQARGLRARAARGKSKKK